MPFAPLPSVHHTLLCPSLYVRSLLLPRSFFWPPGAKHRLYGEKRRRKGALFLLRQLVHGARKWEEEMGGGSHTGRSLPFLPLFRKGIQRVQFLSHLLNISIRRSEVITKGEYEIRAFSMMCKIFGGAKQKAVIRGGKRKREKWLILGCGWRGGIEATSGHYHFCCPPDPPSRSLLTINMQGADLT